MAIKWKAKKIPDFDSLNHKWNIILTIYELALKNITYDYR